MRSLKVIKDFKTLFKISHLENQKEIKRITDLQIE